MLTALPFLLKNTMLIPSQSPGKQYPADRWTAFCPFA